MLRTEALLRISKEVGAPLARVETTISLLEGGATVPFIARYRKESTGNLDEVRIRDIDERRGYYGALEARRQTVLSSIERQGKLSDELKQRILTCFSKNELEDLYLPYKPKRKTKASSALERGLGPLADYIWDQTGTEPVEVFAQQFVTAPPTPAPMNEEIPTLEAAPDAVGAVSDRALLPAVVESLEVATEDARSETAPTVGEEGTQPAAESAEPANEPLAPVETAPTPPTPEAAKPENK